MLSGDGFRVIRRDRQEVMDVDRLLVDNSSTMYTVAICGKVGTDGVSRYWSISRYLSTETTFDLHGDSSVSRSAN